MSATKQQANGLRRLDLRTYKSKVEDLIMAQQTKKEADAAARAADATIKAIVAELSEAMNGAPAALVGGAVLTVKQTSGAAAALTLKDGSKKLWADVTSVLIGNLTIRQNEIMTVFGGRGGSETINVTGTP